MNQPYEDKLQKAFAAANLIVNCVRLNNIDILTSTDTYLALAAQNMHALKFPFEAYKDIMMQAINHYEKLWKKDGIAQKRNRQRKRIGKSS